MWAPGMALLVGCLYGDPGSRRLSHSLSRDEFEFFWTRDTEFDLDGLEGPGLSWILDTVAAHEQTDRIAHVLSTLTEREEHVIRWRFGLDGERPRTLEEIGNVFHITRERVRSIEFSALRRLRHPSRRRLLELT